MDLLVVEGDITDQQVDVLVNAVNSSLKLEHGVARAVRDAAGEEIQQELLNKGAEVGGQISGGTVIETDGYDLPADRVLHAVAVPLGEGASERSIREATSTALEKADKQGHSSIGLPALGCGINAHPLREGARYICEEIMMFEERFLREALIVGYSADEHELLRSVAWDIRSEAARL